MEEKRKNKTTAGSSRIVNVGRAVAGSVIVTGDGNVVIDPSGHISGRDIHISEETSGRILSQDQAFERIDAAVHLNLEQLDKNIAQARSESSQFFKLTLVFAGLGFLVVLAGISLLLAEQITAGVVSTISSIIPEVTAVLFFRKDKELRTTIERYSQHILESQRILTMIDVAETVGSDKEKDSIKKQIIHKALGISV